jgi:prolyl-tRNA synthetase
MQVPGKTLETLPAAQDLYKTLTTANLTVFFDDRNERAGVKFNDADLVGCPIRITLGERGLQTGVVEVKERQASEPAWVGLSEVIHHCQSILQRKTES